MWLSRSVVDINLMIKPENITLLTMGLVWYVISARRLTLNE